MNQVQKQVSKKQSIELKVDTKDKKPERIDKKKGTVTYYMNESEET